MVVSIIYVFLLYYRVTKRKCRWPPANIRDFLPILISDVLLNNSIKEVAEGLSIRPEIRPLNLIQVILAEGSA